MKTKSHTQIFWKVLYSLLLVFYIWIAWNIPYAGDDWSWGLDYGIQNLLTAAINSRYSGNFLIVLMSRSKLLQAVLMGLSYFGIPFLMARLVTCRSSVPGVFPLCFLCANIFQLSMNSYIWRETWGWISGFANYGFSVLGLLLCLFPAMPLFCEEQLPPQTSRPVLCDLSLFFLSFLTQLFLENLTLYIFLYTGILCVICFLRERTLRRQYLSLFAGASAGLLVMFSSSIYSELLSSGTSKAAFRTLSFGYQSGLSEIVKSCITVFMGKAAWIWERNVVLCCFISLVLMILLIRKRNAVPGILCILLAALDCLSILYFILCGHFSLGKYDLFIRGWQEPAELILNLGYFFLVALQIFLLYRRQRGHMWKLLCLWVSAPAVIVPLSVLNIEGFRFFLTSNAFLSVFALFLLHDAVCPLTSRDLRRLTSLILIIFLILCLYFFSIYFQVSLCNRQRDAILEEARITGAKIVKLPPYPAATQPYLWDVSPSEEGWQYFFRLFHGLQWDAELVFTAE